jgi:SAM-dependent methyltransferase/predicted RNA-binding Zn-ribbon protein involved in translation (DUF1610 family)
VLRHLDVAAIDAASRQEVKARSSHLPPITTFRWWARRTEAVTGAVIDAANIDLPGRMMIADPFAGGGVIALSAVLRGHRVYAQDVNPWATEGLATMFGLRNPAALREATDRLAASAEALVAQAYGTSLRDGTPAEVAHTIRVATIACRDCGAQVSLYPIALVSMTTRVDRTGARPEGDGPEGWLACAAGHLQLGPVEGLTLCPCGRKIDPDAHYTKGRRYQCTACGHKGPIDESGPLGWQVALVERTTARAREIDLPTEPELVQAGSAGWEPHLDLGPILPGTETSVLLRHGFAYWQDLYPPRQRVVIEALLDQVGPAALADDNVERVLRGAVIGSAEMAGYCSRWDRRFLKSYEAVGSHRYNFTTLSAEPNVWGAPCSGRGTVNRRMAHLIKAATWYEQRLPRPPVVAGPHEASARRRASAPAADVYVVTGSSARLSLPRGSLDLVCTDPPYHDDVAYAQLSALFRAWARLPAGPLAGDAIVDGRGASDELYRTTLTNIFTEVRRVLRPSGHLVLSYANRAPQAWLSLIDALQDAGFRAVGYEVVSAENDADYVKAGKRACNLDVLLDLVVAGSGRARRHRPVTVPTSAEGQFCALVGSWVLRVGALGKGWKERFLNEVASVDFLKDTDGLIRGMAAARELAGLPPVVTPK